MSANISGGIDYSLLKRHYVNNDYPSLRVSGVTLMNGIAFTATQTYYTVGLMAYLNNTNVVDILNGWTAFTHGQPAVPAYLAAILTALGVGWPKVVPAFEGKDLLFFATENCWIRFNDASAVPHYVPANTYMRFHQKCILFFVQRDTVSGTLRAWIEG